MIFQLYRLHACYAVLVPRLAGRCHKDKEEGDSVIDLILVVVQLLERDINGLVIDI